MRKLLTVIFVFSMFTLTGCVVEDAQSESITLYHTVTTQGVPCIVYVEKGGVSCQW